MYLNILCDKAFNWPTQIQFDQLTREDKPLKDF